MAYEAIEIERDVLKDSVGCQDQVFAAVGGFNVIEFRSTKDIVVHRVPLSQERISEFEEHLLILDTGIRRRAGDIAARQITKVGANHGRLRRMREMVDEGYDILTNGDLSRFGFLLDEAWSLKSSLDDLVSNDVIRRIYEEGREAGALGGKLLGAGGGGFILFFVPPEKKRVVRERLKHLEEIPIKVNAPGSHIIHM